MSAIQTFQTTLRDVVVATLTLVGLGLMGISKPVAQQPVTVNLIGQSTAQETQATIYSADWCGPCLKYIGQVRALMPPAGWVCKFHTDADLGSAHVIINKAGDKKLFEKLEIEQLPCTIIRKNGEEVTRFTGGVHPDVLAERYNEVAKGKPSQKSRLRF